MKKKSMISLEVSDDLKEAIRIKAFNERLSISKVIRKILEEALVKELESIKEKTNNGLEE